MRRVTAALVFVICLAVYLANGRLAPFERAGDSIPNRLLPFAVLVYGSSRLDAFAGDFARHGGYRWYVQLRDGHLVSKYPIGPAIAALPIHAAVLGWLWATGRGVGHTALFDASPLAEKLAASTIAALAALFLHLILLRRLSPGRAMAIALLFGLGTSMWATCSQLLWQHGPVVLGMLAGIFYLDRPGVSRWRLLLAGLAFSLALASRPSVVVYAGALLLAELAAPRPWRERVTRIAWVAAGAVPLTALWVAFNLRSYDSLLGGYSVGMTLFSWSALPGGALGLLVSPNRGLLIYTPIAVVGILGLVRSFRTWRREPLLPCLALGTLVYYALVSAQFQWAGGWSFGPRYVTDLLPVMALGVPLGLELLPRWTRPLLLVAALWSVAVQWNGSFCYPASQWDPRMEPDLERGAWDWNHLELREDYRAWRHKHVWAAPW